MLKLISLNIERRRHWDRIIPFFQKEQPDVLCLSEVIDEDVPRIAAILAMPQWRSIPDGIVSVHRIDNPNHLITAKTGIAILSRFPFLTEGHAYYYYPPNGIALQGEDKRATNAQGLLWISHDQPEGRYTIALTHFTWTPNGYADAYQEQDFLALANLLRKLPPHLLVGDLNAPRGRGMWERFAALYDRDNIPPEIRSTIDPHLHRKPGLTLVVDALFSHDKYAVSDVRVVCGVSDHCAIVATVHRAQPESEVVAGTSGVS